jgi:hypothetical protein
MKSSAPLGHSFCDHHPVVRRLAIAVGRPVALWFLALVIVASGVGLSGGVASAKSGKSLSYFIGHPCALITQAQVAAVFGAAMKPGNPNVIPDGLHCTYAATSTAAQTAGKNVSYGFTPDSSPASVKASMPDKQSQARLSGRMAYCNRVGTVAIYVGSANDEGYQLALSADSCRDSFKLARLALAHIS